MILSRPQTRLFNSQELAEFERRWPQGVTVQQVTALFQERGVKLSEATFRKYVQLGLLPTSKRVGRKGKHRGSRGYYPVGVIRRINMIKGMMEQDLTLEQIRDSVLAVQDGMGQARCSLEQLLQTLEEKAASRGQSGLMRELKRLRNQAGKLLEKIEKLSSRVAVASVIKSSEEQGGVS